MVMMMEDILQDIQLALEAGYPAGLRFWLWLLFVIIFLPQVQTDGSKSEDRSKAPRPCRLPEFVEIVFVFVFLIVFEYVWEYLSSNT